jgi:hypothetical protein
MSMTLIAHQELGSTQASITFSSIPATFTDLLVVGSLRTTRSDGFQSQIGILLNGVGTSMSGRNLAGSGSSVSSFTRSTPFVIIGSAPAATFTSNTFGSFSLYLPNYTSSANKSFSSDTVTENNATASEQAIVSGLFSSSAAISSISFTDLNGHNYVQNSSVSLYGITAGSSGGVVVS